MTTAFVLINTEVATEQEVMEELQKMPGIEAVHLVYGIYDLIIKITADTPEELKKNVSQNLREVDKIRSTMTMITVE